MQPFPLTLTPGGVERGNPLWPESVAHFLSQLVAVEGIPLVPLTERGVSKGPEVAQQETQKKRKNLGSWEEGLRGSQGPKSREGPGRALPAERYPSRQAGVPQSLWIQDPGGQSGQHHPKEQRPLTLLLGSHRVPRKK